MNQTACWWAETHGAIILRLLSWGCLIVPMLPGAAAGMDFRIYYQPQLQMKMLIGEGSIQDGDAGKFLALSRLADRDREGLVTLILNSPGGNVEAAFRLVDAMDKVRVYTIVPNGARCASACASILFASGERRSVIGTGQLGFHSCYRRDGQTRTEDSFCNEIIAANAMQRGVSQAGINRFVKHYGAQDMAWVGRDAACKYLQGLCKPGQLESQRETKAVVMQSLECSKLISIQAQLICGDAELASADRALAELYDQKLRASTQKDRLRADQRAWLRHSRNACVDKACLLRSYQVRSNELKLMRSP